MVRKVLHVIPSIGALRGGPSEMVRQLASSLTREGLETHVATTDDNGPETLTVPHGIPVRRDGAIYWFFPRQSRFYTFSWPLTTWLARHIGEFDLVHIHALFSYASLPAAFLARRRGVPYMVRPLGTLNEWGMTHRRPWLKRLSFRLLESRILRHAALVHYTSEQEQLEGEKLHVGAATIIPNALPDTLAGDAPVSFRAAHPELAGRRFLLFLARLDEKKGLDLLLRAFAAIRARMPDMALVIAGNGSEDFVASLRADAAALGIAQDIVWPGFLTGAMKHAAFAEADVFVLPSYSENFGISVLEAMAAGLPVVVSDQVALHDQVARARAGFVVPCDAGRLADALARLLTDQTLRRSMGQDARGLARLQFSSTAVTKRLIDVYNTVVH